MSAAIHAWAQVLGDGYLTVGSEVRGRGDFASSVSGVTRSIPAVLRPGSVEEVQACVRIARDTRVPIYPISTGCNWGLGSRLPVRGGTVVMDLGRMNCIREINVEHHYAVVEPGVTQRQMAEAIQQRELPLMLNVTGSASGSSLLGNALERGIGYFSSRAESLSGLEVVLGDGELLRTGFGHLPQSQITHSCRHGIGPSLDGLFVQSNFGIVTAAGIDLMPRPRASAAAVIKITDEAKMPALIDRLAELRRAGVLRHVVHVGNRCRTRITLEPLLYNQFCQDGAGAAEAVRRARALFDQEGFGPWSALTGVFGTPGVVRASCRDIRRAFRGFADVQLLTDKRLRRAEKLLGALGFLPAARRKASMLKAIGPLHGLATGVPTDAPMHGVNWPVEQTTYEQPANPDSSPSGMLYTLPFCPMTGKAARTMMDLVHGSFDPRGFEPAVTLNLIDAKSMEAVISLAFDRRDPDQTRDAHACMDELLDRLIEIGFLPYRLGVQSMDRIVDPSSSYWQRIRLLKEVFDPHCILAPGRYNLA